MAKDKASFVLYSDLIHVFDHLSDKEAGVLIKHIFRYVNDHNPELKDRTLKIAFEPIKQLLKRDLKKWESNRTKRSESGRLGGIKSGESRRHEANEANASNSKQNEANEAVSVSGIVSVSVSDSVIKEKKGFAPPVLEDVIGYMSEKIDEFSAMGEAQKFINYYSSNGWMVGKNKMKNWRGAAAGWVDRKDNFKKQENGKPGTSEARIAAIKNF
jgi:hypothetical protein